MIPLDRIGGAPITLGRLRGPRLGRDASADRVLGEMRSLGITATELGAPGFLPRDPAALDAVLDRNGVRLIGGFVPVVLHDPAAARGARSPMARATAELFAAAGATMFVTAVVVDAAWAPAVRAVRGAVGPPRRDARRARRAVRRVRSHACPAPPRRHACRDGRRRRHACSKRSDVRWCLDTGHLLIGGYDPAKFAADAGGSHRPRPSQGRPPSTSPIASAAASCRSRRAWAPACSARSAHGDAPIAATVDALEAAGYAGWYVLEQDTDLGAQRRRPAGPVAASPASSTCACRQQLSCSPCSRAASAADHAAGKQHGVDDVHGGVGRLDVAAHDDRRAASGVDGDPVAELIDRQRPVEACRRAGLDEVARGQLLAGDDVQREDVGERAGGSASTRSRSAGGILPNAELDGAKIVNGPSPLSVSVSPAASTAAASVDSCGLLLAAVAAGSSAIPSKLPSPSVGTAAQPGPDVSVAGASAFGAERTGRDGEQGVTVGGDVERRGVGKVDAERPDGVEDPVVRRHLDGQRAGCRVDDVELRPRGAGHGVGVRRTDDLGDAPTLGSPSAKPSLPSIVGAPVSGFVPMAPVSGLRRRFWPVLAPTRMRSTVGLKSKPNAADSSAGSIAAPTAVAAALSRSIVYTTPPPVIPTTLPSAGRRSMPTSGSPPSSPVIGAVVTAVRSSTENVASSPASVSP